MSTNKIHRYPNPDKIEINQSDLRLELTEFASAIKRRLSPFDFLVLVPAWVPVFISEFNGFADFSGEEVKGIYVAIIGIGSFYWITQAKNSLFSFILRVPFEIPWKWFQGWREMWIGKNEIDPEIKVKRIKDKCK